MSYRLPLTPRSWGTRFDNLLASPSISPPIQGGTVDSTSIELDIPDPTLIPLRDEREPHDASIFVGSLPCNIDQEELSCSLSSHLAEHSEIKSVKVVRDSKGGICAFLQCEDPLSAASLICTLRAGAPRPFMGRILRYEPARAFRTLLVSYRAPVQFFGAAGGSGRKQTVMLDLPYAMRMWKPKGSKYFSVIYNAEAVDVEKRNGATSEECPAGRFFMHPMVYDAEGVRSITSFFGPLERFEQVRTDEGAEKRTFDTTGTLRQLDPFPHNGPRSACMDTGCWEVKWRHRDDCVSALMTLRRIPHITASWAHQPPKSISDQQFPIRDFKPKLLPQATPSCSPDVSLSPLSRVGVPALTNPLPSESNDGVKLSHARCIHQSDSFDFDLEKDINVAHQSQGMKFNWCDEEFKLITDPQTAGKTDWAAWEVDEVDQGVGQFNCSTAYTGEDQSDTLSTPGLAKSPITPRSFASGFPSTPTDLSGELSALVVDPKMKQNDLYNGAKVLKGKSVDPTTLFVGGLEMFGPNAWDESKVRQCFEKYGPLDSVKFFRPYNSCSAFAFVKYKSMDGPVRAIKEEHNRIYEGRTIRVQLRECNGSRNTWKPLRTRGRFTGSQQTDPNKRLGIMNRKQDVESQFQAPGKRMSIAADLTPAQQKEFEVPFHPNHATPLSTEVSTTGAGASNPSSTSYTTEFIIEKREENSSLEGTSGAIQPSSQASSVAVPVHPVTYPSFGYFPGPWFNPYLQQVQYQFPYYGYGGYMMPPPMPRGSSNATSSQPAWSPMSNAYAPYTVHAMTRGTGGQGMDGNDQAVDISTPLVSADFCQDDQNASVPVLQSEAHEQSINGMTVPFAHSQLNVPVWSHYPFQPYQYPTSGPGPGPLNANAKAFFPPSGWELPPSAPLVESQTNHAVGFPPHNLSPSHLQPARRDQRSHTSNARHPRNQGLIGRNIRGTTNFNLSRDNDHLDSSKSTSSSVNWI